MPDMYDLIIIGAGCAGQTAAIYASRARLSVLWLENSFVQGGQIADSGLVDNYPGLPGISGADLAEVFASHAKKLGMEPVREKVLSVRKEENGEGRFCVQTKKAEYLTKTLIYAAGAAHRKLGIPGEEELSGAGVSYCATCDGAFYKDQTVAVVGGGNTACEDALLLSKICKKVYLIHRRDSLRADKVLDELVRETGSVEILWNTIPAEFCGTEELTGIRLIRKAAGNDEGQLSGVTGQEDIIPCQGVFIAAGMVPNSGLLKDLVSLDESGYVIAGEDCASDVPGIFAAGDVRRKPLRQVVTAASDGANAVASVCRFLSLQV